MQDFHARTVFFVRDTPRAMEFYTSKLGFTVDWVYEENGQPYVIQVSLHGMAIIVNQQERPNDERPGHGRLFVGLDEEQSAALFKHIESKGIEAVYTYWGAPTLAILDLDGNEIFFWLSDAERARWQAAHEGTG